MISIGEKKDIILGECKKLMKHWTVKFRSTSFALYDKISIDIVLSNQEEFSIAILVFDDEYRLEVDELFRLDGAHRLAYFSIQGSSGDAKGIISLLQCLVDVDFQFGTKWYSVVDIFLTKYESPFLVNRLIYAYQQKEMKHYTVVSPRLTDILQLSSPDGFISLFLNPYNTRDMGLNFVSRKKDFRLSARMGGNSLPLLYLLQIVK